MGRDLHETGSIFERDSAFMGSIVYDDKIVSFSQVLIVFTEAPMQIGNLMFRKQKTEQPEDSR